MDESAKLASELATNGAALLKAAISTQQAAEMRKNSSWRNSLLHQQVGWGLIDNFERRDTLCWLRKRRRFNLERTAVQAPYRDQERVREYGKCLSA